MKITRWLIVVFVLAVVAAVMLAGCANQKAATDAFVAGFTQGVTQQIEPVVVAEVKEQIGKLPEEVKPVIVQGTQTDWTNPQAVGSYGTALAVALGAWWVNRKKK